MEDSTQAAGSLGTLTLASGRFAIVGLEACSNDGTAGGAIAALDAQGLAGSVPVSGQDADKAALNRVALGTQTVSVWKNFA